MAVRRTKFTKFSDYASLNAMLLGLRNMRIQALLSAGANVKRLAAALLGILHLMRQRLGDWAITSRSLSPSVRKGAQSLVAGYGTDEPSSSEKPVLNSPALQRIREIILISMVDPEAG
jgi:hypothetical protein